MLTDNKTLRNYVIQLTVSLKFFSSYTYINNYDNRNYYLKFSLRNCIGDILLISISNRFQSDPPLQSVSIFFEECVDKHKLGQVSYEKLNEENILDK